MARESRRGRWREGAAVSHGCSITSYHNPCGVEQQEFYSHGSGGYKSKSKAPAGQCSPSTPDKDSGKNLASSRFQGLPASLGFPWPVAAQLRSRPLRSLGALPVCLSLCPLLLVRTLVLGFRAHSDPV